MTSIREVANTLATEFVKTVEQIETSEIQQIEDIIKQLNIASNKYAIGVNGIKKTREKHLAAISQTFELEEELTEKYHQQIDELQNKLAQLKEAK